MNLYLDNIIFSLQKHGGISVVWYELLNRLLKDKSFNCKFVDLPNTNSLRTNIDISKIDILSDKIAFLPLKIQRYLSPNVGISHGVFHSSYYRTVGNSGVKNLTTVHDFTYEYLSSGMARRTLLMQKSNAIRNSDHIICISNNTKRDLLKFHPRVSEDKISVIYNGVSEDYYPLQDQQELELKKLIPFSKGEFVLYVGDRKAKYKNFEIAVKACSISRFPLVTVGGGNFTASETDFLDAKLGKDSYIQLLGLHNSSLNVLYNSAQCLVYPSVYEGFGIPIIEAQKAGCPVICTDKSSIPEVAGNGAIIIKDIDEFKISDLLIQSNSQHIFSSELIKNGFANSNRFSWDSTFEQTKQVYLQMESK